MSTRIEASGAQRRRTAMMAGGLLAALSLPLLATPADAVKRCRWISASGIGTSRNLAIAQATAIGRPKFDYWFGLGWLVERSPSPACFRRSSGYRCTVRTMLCKQR